MKATKTTPATTDASRPKAEGPPLERELKFAAEDLEALRQRLTELEAERVAQAADESNWILDRKGELAKSGSVLRVRADGRGAHLTFKGPARFEGTTKIRVEHEIGVERADGAMSLLAALGYEVLRRYEKIREEWHLGGTTIALDRTPIGDFVEFEGERAEAVALRCGYDPTNALKKSYLQLYEERAAASPGSSRDMLFPK